MPTVQQEQYYVTPCARYVILKPYNFLSTNELSLHLRPFTQFCWIFKHYDTPIKQQRCKYWHSSLVKPTSLRYYLGISSDKFPYMNGYFIKHGCISLPPGHVGVKKGRFITSGSIWRTGRRSKMKSMLPLSQLFKTPHQFHDTQYALRLITISSTRKSQECRKTKWTEPIFKRVADFFKVGHSRCVYHQDKIWNIMT